MKTSQLPALIVCCFFITVLTFGIVYADQHKHTGSLYFTLVVFVGVAVWHLRVWRIKAHEDGSFTLSRLSGRHFTIRPSEISRIDVSYSKSMKTSEETTFLTLEMPGRKFSLSSASYKNFDEVIATVLRGRTDLLQSYHRQLRRDKKRENSLQRQMLWAVIAIGIAILIYEFIAHT